MQCKLDNSLLLQLLGKQLTNQFFLSEDEENILQEYLPLVVEKIETCFKSIDNKYFRDKDGLLFNPYHSGQYLIYLYYYSYMVSREGYKELADKLYYLNKIMHACDIYHEVCMPDSFFLEHPVGTVLGRAKYGNHFFAMQGCTVGGNKGKYPVIGENVKLYSGSKVLGNSQIGNNVTISANTYIKDTDIPENATVFGAYPNLVIKYL